MTATAADPGPGAVPDAGTAPGAGTGARVRNTGVRAVVMHELISTRKFWFSTLLSGIITPLLYVLALGVGLGSIVNRHGNSLGVPYLVFVAPAFLTAAALQTATGSATFPVMAGFKWIRFFHAMVASPITPRQVCDGKLVWIALRTLAGSTLYLAIVAGFGAVQRGWAVLDIPIGALTGVAFAAPVLALTAVVEAEGQAFNVLFRFVVTPMFLFSGTFYPISQLPRWGQYLAYVSPLWHGTVLARGAAIGGLGAWPAVGHVAYLLAWLVVGTALARWRFRVRLTS